MAKFHDHTPGSTTSKPPLTQMHSLNVAPHPKIRRAANLEIINTQLHTRAIFFGLLINNIIVGLKSELR